MIRQKLFKIHLWSTISAKIHHICKLNGNFSENIMKDICRGMWHEIRAGSKVRIKTNSTWHVYTHVKFIETSVQRRSKINVR